MAMTQLVLLRHGQSVWNEENRFTGWTDVDLSQQGREEALEAGRLLKSHAFKDRRDFGELSRVAHCE